MVKSKRTHDNTRKRKNWTNKKSTKKKEEEEEDSQEGQESSEVEMVTNETPPTEEQEKATRRKKTKGKKEKLAVKRSNDQLFKNIRKGLKKLKETADAEERNRKSSVKEAKMKMAERKKDEEEKKRKFGCANQDCRRVIFIFFSFTWVSTWFVFCCFSKSTGQLVLQIGSHGFKDPTERPQTVCFLFKKFEKVTHTKETICNLLLKLMKAKRTNCKGL